MKTPRSQHSTRRLGQFFYVTNPAKRTNPQSLRRTLYDLTRHIVGSDLDRVALLLTDALRTRQGRNLRIGISGEVLYNIICADKTHLKYAHLEAYARHLRIPVSLILLYSRLRANQQDKTPKQNLVMLNAFAKIIADAQKRYDENDLSVYKIDDLVRWVALFQAEDKEPALFPMREI